MTCLEAPGLVVDKKRLAALGGTFLGIIGDANHSFGFHLCSPPSGDYSLAGAVNRPVGTYACAIDAGMNWPASRAWLAWLIAEIREDRIQGVAEVIGSLDGRNVRYWSDSSGWHQDGVPYTGEGHDTWTHISIYRSTALDDHRLLAGWTATGYTNPQEDDMAADVDQKIRDYMNGMPSVEPVKWRVRDEAWQKKVDAALAESAGREKLALTAITALAEGGGVDSAPIVAALKAEGAAIRAQLTEQHAEEMAALIAEKDAELAGLRAELAARQG